MFNFSYQQPKGFTVFFLTELWERNGFYILQTLLIFYLISTMHTNDSNAYVIVGSFTPLAYTNSLFGGMVSDYFIGHTATIILGAILLFFGYLSLNWVTDTNTLTLGLGLIVVGTGLLKPNLSSLLSILYTTDDQEYKDSGYTLYYVGIYIGALAGSLLGGYIMKNLGWNMAFLFASGGILIGLIIFIMGKKKFNLIDKRKKQITILDYIKALIIIAIILAISYMVLHSEYLSLIYFIVIAVICFGFLLYCIMTNHGIKRDHLIAFSLLILLAIGYWGIFFQQFFSISLCIKRTENLSIPVSSLSGIESLGVIIFGPVLNYIWLFYKRRSQDISIITKFSLSFLFNSLSFLILAYGLWYASYQHIYLNVGFIVVSYLLIAIGELSISPTSLSMVTTLVPEKYVGAMMGISLLSIGFGGKLAGLLAANSAINTPVNNLADIEIVYRNSFFIYFLISLATFIIAMIAKKYINRLIFIGKV